MTRPQDDPLQIAIEKMRIAHQRLPYQLVRQIHVAQQSDFLACVQEVIELAGTAHVPVPDLQPGDLAPEEMPGVGLYQDAIDTPPPRKLFDVWEGKGDYDDPWVPNNTVHDQDLLRRRMRADSDQGLDSFRT